MKKLTVSIISLLLFSLITWQLLLTPTHDRNWREENLNLPEINRENNLITIENFRDFWTDEKNIQHNSWKTKTINLDHIEGMDFIISHFSEMEGIAHSFVSFRVKGSENISISMEVRLEEGAEYSPFWGALNQVEMMYIVGSERDLVGARIGYRQEEVFLYETIADAQTAQDLFLKFSKEVNNIAKEPVFYNTIWNNCTSVIVGVIEDQIEKNIWWSYEHLLPGYADQKAFEMNFLANPNNLSFHSLKEQSRISEKEINQWDDNFEKAIRTEAILGYESDLENIEINEYSNGKRNYKYYTQYPKAEELKGVVIYLHGAAPKVPKYAPVHPQGIITTDNHFAGNFSNLRTSVANNNLLYIVPSYGLSEGIGKENINALTLKLQEQYTDIPFYIIGASAGGRVAFQVNEEYPGLFDGIIFVVPAISSSQISDIEKKSKKVWITGGKKDPVISMETLQKLSSAFGAHLDLQEGGHNEPVENINWSDAIEYIVK